MGSDGGGGGGSGGELGDGGGTVAWGRGSGDRVLHVACARIRSQLVKAQGNRAWRGRGDL